MANQIKFNAEGLQHSSSQLKSEANELQSLITRMEGVINGLSDHWEGASLIAYQQQFQHFKPGLNQTKEYIDGIARQIDQALSSAQDHDNNMAGQIKKN